jgi:hypothetical protein
MIRLATSASVLALLVVVTGCPNLEWTVEGSSEQLEAAALTEEQPTLSMRLELTVSAGEAVFSSGHEIAITLGFDTFFAEALSELDVLIERDGEQLLLTSFELEPGETEGVIGAVVDNFAIDFDESGSWVGTFEITLVLLSGGPVVLTPQARALVYGSGREAPVDLQVGVVLEVVDDEAA